MIQRISILAAGLAVASAAAVAAFAAAPAAKPAQIGDTDNSRTCFRVRDIDSVTVSSPIGADGRDGVNLRLNNKDAYQLKMFSSCPQLQDTIRIGVESQNVTGVVCNGPEAKVVVRGTITGPATCQVDTIHKLTPAEVAAMPANERP